jgi:uncharacterized protein (DUF427 family)
MKATYNNKVIAEAPRQDLIYIEGNWYFPPAGVKSEFFKKSDTPYTCPWKGVCQYFDVVDGDKTAKDSAWSYPEPKPSAIDTVKKDFSNYVAFWREVVVAG